MIDPTEPVLLGVIGGAHGIRGECRVKSYTEDPEDLGAYGPLKDARGRVFTVLSARLQKNVVVVRFREVTDRNAAEALNGTELFIDRAHLPDDGEDFYQADLIGLDARSTEGELLGEIIAFHNFGAGDILEIRSAAGGTVMIPFTQAAVPDIDLELGAITVEPVAAGLKDAVEARPEPGEEEGGA
ncbi:ribosome maturation factor RimM [Aureimonas frigidaquae]|uniref:ribosome maturation factor RimM n=1 Tax=Aureimonas frigidaquae TaxID=424757 RepID=UPI0007827592|nr:ribosome maturation factor RimM [Aureimonas frigidaquae]